MALSDIFKSKATRQAEHAALVEAIKQSVEKEAEELAAEQQEIRKGIEARILQEKLDSKTPWFEPIIGGEEATFLNERYRWNDAFIKDLIRKGHSGETDIEVFQNYLDSQEQTANQKIIDAERDAKRASSDPWVEVIGENITDDGRIELRLDWNPAFIHYLRKSGFRGANDDVLVQAWLISLDRNLDDPAQFQ